MAANLEATKRSNVSPGDHRRMAQRTGVSFVRLMRAYSDLERDGLCVVTERNADGSPRDYEFVDMRPLWD